MTVPNGAGPDQTIEVVLIEGDGIGPEISAAVVQILDAADAGIAWVPCLAGGRVFEAGDPSGVPSETVDAIRRCRAALKAPLATPLGRGERSANVTLRETLGTFAAIRPAKTLSARLPGTRFPETDLILIRENFEDLYMGIEFDLGRQVKAALKVTSEANTRRICKTAFALARALGRGRVTGISKSNILKQTDGSFDRIFDEEAALAEDIGSDRILVDAAACLLVTNPARFDVVVTSNLYGDILSDLTAGLVGGLGMCASVNLGQDVAIFEAVHGTAPDIAGRGLANPTALLRAATMLLDHIGRSDVAGRVEAALTLVLEEGLVLTADLARGRVPASTPEFTQAVIAALPRCDPDARRPRWIAPPMGDAIGSGWSPNDLREFARASVTGRLA